MTGFFCFCSGVLDHAGELFHQAGAKLLIEVVEPRAHGVDRLGVAEPVAQDDIAVRAAQELGHRHENGVRIVDLAEQWEGVRHEVQRREHIQQREAEVELAARGHIGVEHELADKVGKVRQRREIIGRLAAEFSGHKAVGLIAGALIEAVECVVVHVIDVFFGHDPAS